MTDYDLYIVAKYILMSSLTKFIDGLLKQDYTWYVTLKRGGNKICRNIVKFDELKKTYEIGYP